VRGIRPGLVSAALVAFWTAVPILAQEEAQESPAGPARVESSEAEKPPKEKRQSDDGRKRGWSDKAAVSVVASDGNSETTSIGLKNVLSRIWEQQRFSWELGINRVESLDGDRFGVGDLGQFVVKDPPKTVDPERFYNKLRFYRNFRPTVFWVVSGDAEKNIPAGVFHTRRIASGLGNTWVDRETMEFRSIYAATYTDEELELDGTNEFPGFRLLYQFEWQFTRTATFDSEMTFDNNLEDLDDWRVDAKNGVSVSISEILALKTSLHLLYRNIPALEEIEVYDADPNEGSAILLGTAIIPKRKRDLALSTSLVVNF
jgi:hypothetical protein